MGLGETTLFVLALVAMFLCSLASFLPYIPGPVLVWSVGALYIAFTGIDLTTFAGLVVMSGLMVVGATADFWMQFFGLRLQGGSCLATVGSMVGGVLATFLIPIPIIGTIIGIVAGAWAFELLRSQEMDPALLAGKAAFQVYLLSAVTEFISSLLILGVFAVAVWLSLG